MIVKEIKLSDEYKKINSNATLTAICPSNNSEVGLDRKRRCVLVLPGGAYAFCSEREAEPVALRFAGKDMACFVLRYSVAPNIVYPYPFVEVYAALAYIRKNADYYHVDVDKIAVIGFSAGGHLAAASSCYHEDSYYANYLGIKLEEMKINACILGYPVISSEYGHFESFENICHGDKKLMEKMSIEKQAGPNFPKTFIWHTTFDDCVPLKNSLALTERLRDNNVLVELHVYPIGGHGQSLADRSVYSYDLEDKYIKELAYNTQWIDNAIRFLEKFM